MTYWNRESRRGGGCGKMLALAVWVAGAMWGEVSQAGVIVVVEPGLGSGAEFKTWLGGQLGKANAAAERVEQLPGVFYANMEASPHQAMRTLAVLTGRHALDSGVWGEHPAHTQVDWDAILADGRKALPAELSKAGWEVSAAGWWGLGHDAGALPVRAGLPGCDGDERVAAVLAKSARAAAGGGGEVRGAAEARERSVWALWNGPGHVALMREGMGEEVADKGVLTARALEGQAARLGSKGFMWVAGAAGGAEAQAIREFLGQLARRPVRGEAVADEHQVLVLGGDFAWWWGSGVEGRREEARPVSPQDFGVSLGYALGVDPDWAQGKAGKSPGLGRDVRRDGKWEQVAANHVGELSTSVSPGQAKFRGARVYTPDGVLRDGLNWQPAVAGSGEVAVGEQDGVKWLAVYDGWWRKGSKLAASGYYARVPGEAGASPLELTPEDWQVSVVDPGVTRFWLGKGWNRGQVAGALREGLGGGDLAGAFRLELPRDGHYVFEMELLPGKLAGNVVLGPLARMKPGVAVVQSGPVRARIPVQEGATRVRLGIDLTAGKHVVDVWLAGQRGGLARLTPPFCRVWREGEAKTPVIEFSGKSATP